MLLFPIILLLVAGTLLVGTVGSSLSNWMNGGIVSYDESEFQRYANQQYAAEFGTSSAYEDNLLIVFLTNEETDDYYCIAWVGDNIRSEVSNLFGNETTAFGAAVQRSVGAYYEFSISSNLATVMETMTTEVSKLGLDSSFRSQSDHSVMTESHLTNRTALTVSADTVGGALKEFTAETDIPAVIVVDTMEAVFGKTLSATDIIVMVVLVGLIVLAIVLIVRALRRKKDGGNNDNDPKGGGYNRDPGRYQTDYESKNIPH